MSLSDLEEDLDRFSKLEDAGATSCRGPPIFDNYSDYNEEYSSISTTSSSQKRGGLEDEGATTCREAPVLNNHSQLDDHPDSFLGNHLGLIITSTQQGHFVYWKGLEPLNYSNTIPVLWSSRRNCPSKRANPLSHLRRGRGQHRTT
jgi:hypothetical protein